MHLTGGSRRPAKAARFWCIISVSVGRFCEPLSRGVRFHCAPPLPKRSLNSSLASPMKSRSWSFAIRITPMPSRSASAAKNCAGCSAGTKSVFGHCFLWACPCFSNRLDSICVGSASFVGTGAELRMKQLAASISAMKSKSPSCSVWIGSPFSLNAIQASLT